MAGEYNGAPGGGGAALRRAIAAGELLVLDGATGTELERRGLESAAPLWSAHALLRAPEEVLRVHRRYVAAGVDLLTANTFRTQARTLRRAGLAAGEDAVLTARAVALARRAADESGRRVFVLGSDPPLEDCYAPADVPEDDALAREHARHVANLRGAGADAILVETMNCIREATAALRAAREAGAEALVGFVCWEGDRLLSGEPLAEALEAVAPLGPLVVGVNCLPPRAVAACLPALRAAGRPFGVHANLGAPAPEAEGGRTDAAPPEVFAEAAASWAAAGARLVGGCCGTTPSHLRAVVSRLRGRGVG